MQKTTSKLSYKKNHQNQKWNRSICDGGGGGGGCDSNKNGGSGTVWEKAGGVGRYSCQVGAKRKRELKVEKNKTKKNQLKNTQNLEEKNRKRESHLEKKNSRDFICD